MPEHPQSTTSPRAAVSPTAEPELEAALKVLAVTKPELMIDLTLEAFRALKARGTLLDEILKVATIADESDRIALIDRCRTLQDSLEESKRSVLAKHS